MNHLKKDRKLMAPTIGRILSAIVTEIKFTNQHVADVETLLVVILIRNLQKQFSREQHMVKRRKREGFSSEKGGQFLFAHILDEMPECETPITQKRGMSSPTPIEHGICEKAWPDADTEAPANTQNTSLSPTRSLYLSSTGDPNPIRKTPNSRAARKVIFTSSESFPPLCKTKAMFLNPLNPKSAIWHSPVTSSYSQECHMALQRRCLV